MNEHPLDFHPTQCKNFAAAYMQAARAERQASAAKMQFDTADRKHVTAKKHTCLAYRRFQAATKHYDLRRFKFSETVQKATARKRFFAAIRLHRLLSRKSDRLGRLAIAELNKFIEARELARHLSKHVDIAFQTVFSGNKARLL